MGLSFRKRLGLSHQILMAVDEALELQMKYNDLFNQLNAASKELSESTDRLLDLHKKLIDDSNVSDEIEVTDKAVLQIVTTHGNYVVDSPCPEHKMVHNNQGWYICVDDGIVNVYGWHPNVRNMKAGK